MRAHVRLGHILGIEIGLHYSWFVIAVLIASSLAARFRFQHPEWDESMVFGLAVGTALLFFVSLLLHELSHAAVARLRGLPVRSIVLFALGGVSQIEREAEDARTEFWVGVVGPITSGVIAAICLWSARLLGWSPDIEPATPALAALTWLGYINAALAVFNLMPGFPLDGGRVLRALVWWYTGNARQGLHVASRIGEGFGWLLIAYGLFNFLLGAGLGGLWLSFIGWFLLEGARGSRVSADLRRVLEGVPVGAIMRRECPSVDAATTVNDFVHEALLPTGRRCFAVVSGDTVAGIVTPEEVKQVEQPQWSSTRVGQIMHPLSDAAVVSPQTPVSEIMDEMIGGRVGELAVVSGGQLQGFLARDHLLDYLRRRMELEQ